MGMGLPKTCRGLQGRQKVGKCRECAELCGCGCLAPCCSAAGEEGELLALDPEAAGLKCSAAAMAAVQRFTWGVDGDSAGPGL